MKTCAALLLAFEIGIAVAGGTVRTTAALLPGGAHWNVSNGGGSEPQWAHSGRELFYRDGAGAMRSVEVSTSPTFRLGTSRVLFNANNYAAYAGHQQYAVGADDQRFLMVAPVDATTPPTLVLIKNWTAALRER